MKNLNLLLISLSSLSFGNIYAAEIFRMDFATDTSSEFSPVADATNAEASLAYKSTGGNFGGALTLTGVNPADGIGKSYIWLANMAVPALSAEDVTISFDMKYDTPINNSAIHFLTSNPGALNQNMFDLQNQGINENTWTTISHTISGITPGNTNIQMQFQIAAGAIAGAGGSLLLDNIIISQVPEPSTYALIAGFVAFSLITIRRKLTK